MPGDFERHEHRDLAEAVGDEVVDISADDAVRDLKPLGAAQGHVLADRRDCMRDGIRDRAAPRIFGGFQRLDIIALLERDMGDVANEVLEALVARHEIGLGIDLDDHAVIAAVREPHKALGRDASGFLRGLGETLLAKPIHRVLDLALRFI